MPQITPAQYRRLQTYNPRLTEKYQELLSKQVAYHKLDKRADDLLKTAQEGLWSETHTTEYETIDRQLTEGMLSAEHAISKKVSNTYALSPKLKQAVSTLKYWQLCLKNAHGKSMSNKRLLYLQQDANIDPTTIPDPVRIMDIVTNLRKARKTLKAYQQKHLELRKEHLTSLAEALLIARDPDIMSKPTAMVDKKRAKELHRIIRKKASKQLHQRIGYLLKPQQYNGGLNSIDVPAASDKPYPEGSDPKSWTGPWKTVSQPEEIANYVIAANARQYHQAHDTPFGSKALASYFGYRADTAGADALVNGQLPPRQLMQTLLPET
jgi:hypothetical protein